MDMLRVITLVLGCTLTVNAQVPSFWGCPEKNIPMPDFELSRFLGVWYEILRVPTLMEAGASCVKNNYTQTADGKVHVENELKPLGQPRRVIVGELKTAGRAGEGKITIKYKVPILPAWETTYYILNTDYDSYAVVWNCASYGIMNIQSAWLMARQRQPPGTLLQKAFGILDAYGLPRNYFVETPQENCEIVSVAPDVVPSNPIPDTATRTSSVSDTKITPAGPNDDKLKNADVQKPTQDEAPAESAKSPPVVDDVPKVPVEATQEVVAAPYETEATQEVVAAPYETEATQEVVAAPYETEATQEVVATPDETEQINSASDTKTEIPSDTKEEKV